jgi:predicted nucleic acid-binding protein
VTRYLLDTDIISNVIEPRPSEPLLAWMAARHDQDLFIASLTLAEIRRGTLGKPKGKKRATLDAWFSGPEGPQALFSGRILPFDFDKPNGRSFEKTMRAQTATRFNDFVAVLGHRLSQRPKTAVGDSERPRAETRNLAPR